MEIKKIENCSGELGKLRAAADAERARREDARQRAEALQQRSRELLREIEHATLQNCTPLHLAEMRAERDLIAWTIPHIEGEGAIPGGQTSAHQRLAFESERYERLCLRHARLADDLAGLNPEQHSRKCAELRTELAELEAECVRLAG